jgi:hypothetical protein
MAEELKEGIGPDSAKPSAQPVSTSGYVLMTLAGTLVFDVLAVIPWAASAGVYAFVRAVLFWPILWLAVGLMGLPPFVLLRKIAPSKGIGRFAFIVLILTPIVWSFCLVAFLWIDGFVHNSPYPLMVRLRGIAPLRPVLLSFACFCGLVWWGVDRAAATKSEGDPTRS